jgi:hypothetical protein
MSKLYVFGIGGTGSRVLESLTMLLACGVDCGVDTIVPVIIDFDENNGNYDKTKKLIDKYIEVQKSMVNSQTQATENKFFRTKIEKLGNREGILLTLDRGNSSEKTDIFNGFIGYDKQMFPENKALIELLFSNDALNLKTSEGFQGNPNIGSVALNQFANNNTFHEFAQDFKDANSKIFIISSIFGGTGASGFPLLLKTLNSDCKDDNAKSLANWTNVMQARKAALTVMPYFAVKKATDNANKNSLVDSSKWGKMVKAALHYYKTLDKKLDTLYYIGDKTTKDKQYDHHKGNIQQKNDAHFVELASAMAILDFANSNKDMINIHRETNKDGTSTIVETTYKEFGVADGEKNDFSMLEKDTQNLILEPLSRFLLFAKYMGYHVDKEKDKTEEKKVVIRLQNNLFDEKFIHTDAYKTHFSDVRKELESLEFVQKKFVQWLLEMQEQSRKFIPFDLETPNAFGFIKGSSNITVPKKGQWYTPASKENWGLVNAYLNDIDKNIGESISDKKVRFIELFYRVTKGLITSN